MPLHKIEVINEDCIWGIWQITEPIEQLLNILQANTYDLGYLDSVTHEGKRLESLAVRVLAQRLLSYWQITYKGIIKDIHDKPYLADCPYHISVSHTYGYAVVIIHRLFKVGIDIEFVKEKLIKVAPKYLSTVELRNAQDDLEKLCIYWCAKEVLYKKNGMKFLSLKDEIFIYPFTKQFSGIIRGEILKQGKQESARIVYMKLSDLLIAYSYE